MIHKRFYVMHEPPGLDSSIEPHADRYNRIVRYIGYNGSSLYVHCPK